MKTRTRRLRKANNWMRTEIQQASTNWMRTELRHARKQVKWNDKIKKSK